MDEMDFKPMTARQSYNRIGLALFMMGVLSNGIAVLLSMLINFLSAWYPWLAESDWIWYLVSFIPLYCVAMPISYLIMKPVVISRPDSERMLPGDFIISLLMCFPLVYLGNIVGNLLSMLLSGGQASNPVSEMTSQLDPVNVIVLVVVGPILEEFFFRKQIIDRLGRFGEKQVILFSALAFGLFHMNLYQFFYAFLLGLVFGYVYTRSRRLRYTIAMHMIINLVGGVIPALIMSNIDERALEQLSDFSGSNYQIMMLSDSLPAIIALGIFGILMLIAVIVGIVFLFTKAPKHLIKPAPAEIPKGQARKTIYGAPWVIVFILFCIAMMVLYLVAY
ncbi:MAG: CPBP family intramembrane glutamic endopeptidase [Lachnospiraceae bacterium]|jgi:membrane protease YdiL (CAAX protease family)